MKLFLATAGALAALVYPAAGLEGMGQLVAAFLAGSIFYNWLWRVVVFAAAWAFLPVALPGIGIFGGPLLFLALFNVPTFAILGIRKKQPVAGAVFVTGADSGMGFWTAGLLAEQGELAEEQQPSPRLFALPRLRPILM